MVVDRHQASPIIFLFVTTAPISWKEWYSCLALHNPARTLLSAMPASLIETLVAQREESTEVLFPPLNFAQVLPGTSDSRPCECCRLRNRPAEGAGAYGWEVLAPTRSAAQQASTAPATRTRATFRSSMRST